MAAREEEIENQIDQALADFLSRRDRDARLNRESFLAAYPQIERELRLLLEAADCIEQMAGPTLAELSALEVGVGTAVDSSRSSEPMFDPNAETNPSIQVERESVDLTSGELSDATLAYVSTSPDEPNGRWMPRSTPDTTQPSLPCRFGEYMLEKIIGRGGMGVVYVAKQVQLDRPVAIKMIRSGCLASEEEIQRFYAEARSAAKLDHPNIVTVYQCGECEGHHYFSMDYVPGTDLARLVAKGPIDQRQAARYVRDVARAIAYAHEQGILHRDLKPANVLIDQRDQVVITDFGLAKLIGTETGLTATGAALGTPSYMSPEQAGGRGSEQSQSTDIYSLGAILFALLTGRPPFQTESVVQTIMQVMHKQAPSVRSISPQVSADLETIVDKCLQKQPGRRYGSAAELADDLDRYLHGQPIHARPHNALQRSAHWAMGIPLIAALMGHRSLEPSISHRIAQWVLVGLLVCIPLLYMSSRQSSKWWSENHLPSQILIAAGNPDGAYHAVASYLARRLDKSVGHSPSVIPTDGSIENLNRLMQDDAQLALLQASSVRGSQICVIAPLYYEAVHILVRRGVEASRLQDLRGRRLALGLKYSGTRLAANVIFEHCGLSEQDFKIVDEDWNHIRDHDDIDAAIVVLQTGHPKLNEMLGSGEYHLIALPETHTISKLEPTFRVVQLSKEDYPQADLATPIETLATTAFLSAKSNTPNRLVRACLDALYDPSDAMPGIMPAKQAAHWSGLLWHPAAREYFESIESPKLLDLR